MSEHCDRCGLPLDNQHPIGCRDIMSQPTEAERAEVRKFLGSLLVYASSDREVIDSIERDAREARTFRHFQDHTRMSIPRLIGLYRVLLDDALDVVGDHCPSHSTPEPGCSVCHIVARRPS